MFSYKKLRTLLPFAIISLAVTLSSCSGASKTFKNSERWLPADFNPGTSFLLVDTAGIKENQVQKMAAHLQKKYPYPYQFVSGKEIENDATYSDVNKYRFIMMFTNYSLTITQTSSSGMMRTRRQLMLDFYFQDRLKKTKYPNSEKGSSWPSPTFNALINTILKERK